jgi:hypothetical protein
MRVALASPLCEADVVSDYDTRRATRYLPHVVVATTAVAVLPVAAVWWLRSRGAIASPWVGVVLALALSLAASCVGRAYWKRRRGPRDLLFGELLLWGWLRRVRMERQLARSMGLLRVDEPPGGEVESASRRFHVLSQLVVALEAQDAYTDGHSRRVAAHAVLVARRMGLTREDVTRIRAAAAVHDIGKVRVPRDVFDKPGELTSAEFALVKAHADAGAEIVACLGDPELTAIVRHHHERFDGTGYPSGLAYEQIPLGARIIAVADTFDALTSVRPYRPAAPHKRALEALATASGGQLDPVAVRAFLRSYSGNKAIVFWTLLTVSPQRMVAWLGDKRPAARNASLGSMITSAGAMIAIGVTAISAPLGPGPRAYEVRDVDQQAPSAIAAAPVPSRTSVPRRSSRHAAFRLSAAPAPYRTRAQPSGSVSAASRGAADRAPGGPRPVHPRAVAGGPGGRAGGGPRGRPGGGSGGGPAGSSKGGSGRGPVGGSNPPPDGGPAGGPAGGSAGGPARGSGGGSANGSGSGSASGSSAAGGGGSGPTGTRVPATKDQCKTGGYGQYGFANQGQCVAFVERGSR